MAEKRKQARNPQHVFRDAAGAVIHLSAKDAKFGKLYRDTLRHIHGDQAAEKGSFTELDLDNTLNGHQLTPSEQNPICVACQMFSHNCGKPFLPYHGNPHPLVTVVFESVSAKEDIQGYISADGSVAGLLRKLIDAFSDDTGVTSDDCRFVALTRCAHRQRQPLTLKGKAEKCKIFAVQDFAQHRPTMIMPVGSLALGMLCHKSNAQEWGGRMLTYRGWPDDWLTDPGMVKPRKIKVGGVEREVVGHPFFGPPPGPDRHCLLYPIQNPPLVFAQDNALVTDAWKRQILRGLKLAKTGVPPLQYDLPHYTLLTEKEDVVQALRYVSEHPGMIVAYDTETTGLHPFHGDAVVFMMFRFVDPESGEPVAFGFPWNYDKTERCPVSPLLPHLAELRPLVFEALTASRLVGHNLTFDILFTFCDLVGHANMAALDGHGQIRGAWRESMRQLNALADAARYDTWHMAYCRHQTRGSLGLEVLAYDYVPELAGYEEDMELLIRLEKDTMHPDYGGHYARCPVELWESHFKPYVMGDVEVCARARDVLEAKMADAKTYQIPIAHVTKRGFFRHFEPPPRAWLYRKIMAPASQVLMKIMGRGMNIDGAVLEKLEVLMPQGIQNTIDRMKAVKNPKGGTIQDWIKVMKQSEGQDWELDLEKKAHLRDVLFKVLGLRVQRLTKTGRKRYGEEEIGWRDRIRLVKRQETPEGDLDAAVEAELLKYAALDKFTLNKLAVDHEEVRPLQDYRKIYKLYNTYVRPLRNYFSEGLDKKERTKISHLCGRWAGMLEPDTKQQHWESVSWLIHAWFMLTGTRGGRLSCRDPNLQQLPKKPFEDYNVKEMYISRFGRAGCLYGADFSQIELRIMAAVSGDQSMVDAYWNGIDLHTLTASRLFKLPYETFSKEHMRDLNAAGHVKEAKELALKRDIAKTCNFLTGYGGGAFGLQTVLANNQIYWQLEECERLIRLFFDSYPAVRDLLSYYKRFIQANNVAVSIFGRIRVFEEAQSGDTEIASKAMRAGCNHLIQSTASDMMLICLVVIEQLMRDEGLESILCSTVHDSLVIDALRSELPKVHEIVDDVLNHMPEYFKAYLGQDYDTSWMIVPFAGDSDVGWNYADMRGVPKENIDWDRLLSVKRA